MPIFTMIKVMWLALTRQPNRQYKFELYQREQAKWFKRHASVGGGPKDLNGKQRYFGHDGDTLFPK